MSFSPSRRRCSSLSTAAFPIPTTDSHDQPLQMMALVGEQFDEADAICGVVASVRQTQDKLAMWTKAASNEATQ